MWCINEMMVSMALSSPSSFVLASNNKGKVREILPMFNAAGFNLITPADLGLEIAPKETGKTFEENSCIKAWETYKFLKDLGHEASGVVADDSGFCVDALGGLPGVDSALYLGENVPKEVRNASIISQMETKADRTARFVCVVTCFICGKKEVVRGEVFGEVAHYAKGDFGFGYDPIFYLPEYKKTMAELPLEEKNKLSARGKAFELLLKKIREMR